LVLKVPNYFQCGIMADPMRRQGLAEKLLKKGGKYYFEK
jgi:hypothetical protein